MVGSGTMRDELMALLGVPENDMIGEVGVAHDMEQAKRVLAEFVSCENLDVFLQTPVVDALMAGASLEGLLVATKEGLRAMEGKIVIDATGDGDVAWFAGAPVDKGRADGLMQPVTLEFTLDGVDESRAVACIGDVDDVELNGERFLDYCARCARQGLLPEQLAEKYEAMSRYEQSAKSTYWCISFGRICPGMKNAGALPAALRWACGKHAV